MYLPTENIVSVLHSGMRRRDSLIMCDLLHLFLWCCVSAALQSRGSMHRMIDERDRTLRHDVFRDCTEGTARGL